MTLRKYSLMALLVSMMLVLLCQNCFASGGTIYTNTDYTGSTVIQSNSEIAPGQVIVAIKLGYESTIINDITLSALGVVSVKNVYGPNSSSIDNYLGHSTWLFELNNKTTQAVYDAINILTKSPYVVYAQPNYIMHIW